MDANRWLLPATGTTAVMTLTLPEPPRETRSAAGFVAGWDASVEIVDVVGGANRWAVDVLLDVHAHAFPAYAFALDEIEADAEAGPVRRGLIVHQWLVLHRGEPAGCVLFDINLARRVALVHFLAIARAGRTARVGGRPLSSWLCHQVAATLERELAVEVPDACPLGVFGESSSRLVRRWRGIGFRPLDVPYAEPVAGRSWRDSARDGDPQMRQLTLMWLPSAGTSLDAGTAANGGAAAFLIDHYRLPLHHPTVVAAAGVERIRPGAQR